MDPHYLSRLQDEQRKALYETDLKINQIEQFKVDYTALQDRLRSLPDKITHDIMVPFGKLAFMPGQMVHTNEILVLLGDNWFVERSAKQAGEIAARRIAELDKKLNSLRAQRKLLEPRLGFTSNMQAELQGQGDVKEIVEEYDEEKEKLWDEEHRKNVRKYKEEVRRSRTVQRDAPESESKPDPLLSDSALWSRLDELEKMEEERGEMEDENSEDDSNSNANSSTDRTLSPRRRVSWADLSKIEEEKDAEEDVHDKENTDEENDDKDDDDEETDDGSEEDVESSQPLTKKIIFKHTPGPAILPHAGAAGDAGIYSPADIYKLYSPKSILKKSLDTETNSVIQPMSPLAQTNQSSISFALTDGASSADYSETDEGKQMEKMPKQRQAEDADRSSAQKAFTGLVVEKNVSESSNGATAGPAASSVLPSALPLSSSSTPPQDEIPASSSSDLSAEPQKRVSRFKAARMKQNLS